MSDATVPAEADITILGGGPVGSALALLLARATRQPDRIVLCTPAPRAAASGVQAPAADPRVIALNHGSRVLLQSLGAWPEEGADIHDIHVSQRGRLGRTLISRADFGVPALGTVVRYDRLAATLAQALSRTGVTVRDGVGLVVAQEPECVVVGQGGRQWSSALCVQADGGTFDTQQRQDVYRPYAQHAVLATVQASQPRLGWAWERFTREGPLALLPFPADGAAPVGRYSLVWCCAPERANLLMGLEDAAFTRELEDAFGDRLGAFTLAGPRQVYPLGLNLKRRTIDGRLAAIGNAAQTLHPVAGQGLNLGLRDAAGLAAALARWQHAPHGDPRPALQAYARTRRGDRWLTAGLTDFMPRAFASGIPAVEHAGGLALLALDTLAPLRRPLASHLLAGLRD